MDNNTGHCSNNIFHVVLLAGVYLFLVYITLNILYIGIVGRIIKNQQ